MRKQIAIFIACLILPLSAVRAGSDSVCKVGDAEIADKQLCIETGGCQYIDSRCEKCKDGTYGKYGTCVPCKDDWPHSHLLDDYGHIYLGDSAPTGATKEEHCYQECKEDGVRIPGKDNAFKVKTSDIKYYDRTCVYTLGCDISITTNINGAKVTNVCNSYFAYPNTDIDSSSCQPQWWDPKATPTKPPYVGATIECNDYTKDKYYIYVSDTTDKANYGKFKCYSNTCVDENEYVVVPDKNIGCDINSTFPTLGECKLRYPDCKEDSQLANQCTDLLGQKATVAGQMEWQNTKYNYDKCTCTVIQDITDDNNTKIGTRSFQYGTISDTDGKEASWDTSKPTTQVESCYAGYYESGNTCKKTEPGYYSPAPDDDKKGLNGKEQYPCPAGRSSAAGAGSESDCGIKRGEKGTKFCDRVGCFTLPPLTDDSKDVDEIIKFAGDKTN